MGVVKNWNINLRHSYEIQIWKINYLAKRREYISEKEFEKHYIDAFNLMNMIIAFKKKIN